MEVKKIINAWIKERLRSASHVLHLVVMGIFGLNYWTLWMMVVRMTTRIHTEVDGTSVFKIKRDHCLWQ